MKVAVTDYSFPDLAMEEAILRPQGHEIVALKEKRPAAELSQLVADADAVITQFAPVNAEVIASMQKAKVIVRYGIGVDNVDLDAARERRIPVCNIPDYCIDEVADHTLAFILSLTRQVVSNTTHMRSGKWGIATPVSGMAALRDLTVGVVGFGRIGREVASRLLPFKAKVLVFDPVVKPEDIVQSGCVPASLPELLGSSDVITLHCPSNAHTRGLLNRESLAQAKPGVRVINLARGDLIQTDALVEALQSGQVGGAALDVFQPEPIPGDHPLLKFDNVVVASHIASVSVPAVRKLREGAAQIAALALAGKPLPNVVNGVTPDAK
ncbi:C-terminal binding protein [Planctomicrobium sp. SH661]|uniref:C-terminal binding protein n=1 Tax=Planctomicrobium sp. SH661 TaxID=3448124 RepID=UPI003F5C5265